MATKKIRMNQKTAAGYDILHPETNDQQVLVRDGTRRLDEKIVEYDSRLAEMVHVLKHATGDGVADDTAGLLAAIAEAKSSQKTLYSPKGYTFRITSTVDFSDVQSIYFDGSIVVDFDGLGVVCGGMSDSANNGKSMYFRLIKNTADTTPTSPLLRIAGLKDTILRSNYCRYIQLYADSDNPKTDSTAYCNFYFDFCSKLEFNTNPSPTGSTTQWINENRFWGGRIKDIIMDGTYPHNNNRFYGPTLEGGNININSGHSNCFYDCRMESLVSLTFGANTHSNIFTQLYASSMVFNVSPISGTVVDNGSGNIYCRSQDFGKEKIEIVSINKASRIFDGDSDYHFENIVPGLEYLTQSTLNDSLVYETDYIPVINGSQFLMHSDRAVWKCRIYLYDSNRTLISNATDPDYINMTIKRWNTGYYDKSVNVSEMIFEIKTTAVSFIKFQFRVGSNSASDKYFKYANLYMYARHQTDYINYNLKERVGLAIQSASPTKGFAKLGEIVGKTAGGVYVCTKSIIFPKRLYF